VIFLDQFEKSPGFAPGGSQKKMFEPCNKFGGVTGMRRSNPLTNGSVPTDPVP